MSAFEEGRRWACPRTHTGGWQEESETPDPDAQIGPSPPRHPAAQVGGGPAFLPPQALLLGAVGESELEATTRALVFPA